MNPTLQLKVAAEQLNQLCNPIVRDLLPWFKLGYQQEEMHTFWCICDSGTFRVKQPLQE